MKTILLIEDDTALRSNIRELLEMNNYEVMEAENGKVGIEMALNNVPDIIISDILMPKADGYQVLSELSNHNTTLGIPFIFISAKTDPIDIRKGMNLGADDYLTKPFSEEDLITSIESRLAKTNLLKNYRKTRKKKATVEKEEIENLEDLRTYFNNKGERIIIEKNENVYKEQKKAFHIYYLKEGLVKTHQMDDYGKEIITGLYKKNDFFGVYWFKQVSNYPETATALDDTTLYQISHRTFKKILAENHKLPLELAQLLSDNLTILKTHLLEMAYASVLKKTTNTILQFAELMKGQLSDEGIKISRSDLASIAGISTESFIRSLSSLKKEGLIDIEGRNIKIVDLQRLAKLKF